MVILAWIVRGLGAGLLAMLISGGRSQGLILTHVIGAARRRPGWRSAAASQDRDDVIGQRDTARACTASRLGNGDGDASPRAGGPRLPARWPADAHAAQTPASASAPAA
jgi:hypothetical protein